MHEQLRWLRAQPFPMLTDVAAVITIVLQAARLRLAFDVLYEFRACGAFESVALLRMVLAACLHTAEPEAACGVALDLVNRLDVLGRLRAADLLQCSHVLVQCDGSLADMQRLARLARAAHIDVSPSLFATMAPKLASNPKSLMNDGFQVCLFFCLFYYRLIFYLFFSSFFLPLFLAAAVA